MGCADRGATVRVAPPPGPVAAESALLESLVEAMGQRLALMPQVAEWKRARDRPVRDRPRELQVLDQAVAAVDRAARRAGRAPWPADEVRRFYQAQIDAAVGIQRRILGEAPQGRPRVPDLEKEIRPELDRLGTRIAELLVLQSGAPERSHLERLTTRHWRVDGLTPDAAAALADALERLLANP